MNIQNPQKSDVAPAKHTSEITDAEESLKLQEAQ